MGTPVTAGTQTATAVKQPRTPSFAAGATFVSLVTGSVLVAAFFEFGDGFVPRVATIDGLAGLTFAAFIVDRLLTFVPPMGADREPQQRAIDLTVLRLGYGAVLGAAFVILTDLHAIAALAPDSPVGIEPGVDRAVAVLAIAGGVAGLGTLVSALNPKPDTDGEAKGDKQPRDEALPAPSDSARAGGIVMVVLASTLAILATAVRDDQGIDLLGSEQQADATMAIVVRFGVVLLAAGIVQQLVEQLGRLRNWSTNDRAIALGGVAVILGVVAAWAFDLYLLHNVGFFGAGPDVALNDALAGSSPIELWGDTMLTGLVIAAGTKPLHDFAARLRKTKQG